MRTELFITLEDLAPVAAELREMGTSEWVGEDGTQIIMTLVECPHDSYRSVCIKCAIEG